MKRQFALAAAALAATLAATLAAALAFAQPAAPSAFPDANGPFSAKMLFVPRSMLPEFDKPAGQTPFIVVAEDAKVGDAVALKIMFTGPGVDGEGQVDVTYDIRILGPDGKLHGGIQETGLEAARSFTPPGGAMLDNRRQVVAMRFDPQDAPGVYRAEAVLHDKVGQRDIPLTAEIELKK